MTRPGPIHFDCGCRMSMTGYTYYYCYDHALERDVPWGVAMCWDYNQLTLEKFKEWQEWRKVHREAALVLAAKNKEAAHAQPC